MEMKKFFTIMKRTTQAHLTQAIMRRTYHQNLTKPATSSTRDNLFSRMKTLGHPENSMVPVLDKWVEEGNPVSSMELRIIVRSLRARKRYGQALEVSEWTHNKGLVPFTPGDRARQLDLIGKVKGLESAETFFNTLDDQYKVVQMYGALLSCYAREGLVEKCLSVFSKMKELGFVLSPLVYNNLMCVYLRTAQHEKVLSVFSEMKEKGVSPDTFSYRICLRAHGVRNNLNMMQSVLEDLERQPQISISWLAYSIVANIYINAGLKEKAIIYLKKCEALVGKDPSGYSHLISLYAKLGSKDQIMRLWKISKSKGKKQPNSEYIVMLCCLAELGGFEEAENVLDEWETSCQLYDFRVPNTLISGYCKQGLVEEAELILRDIVMRGKTPTPNSWSIIASGYAAKQNMARAFECFKEVIPVLAQNTQWRPKPELICSILDWLGDNVEFEEVEKFVESLKFKLKKSTQMYNALLRACIRSEKDVNPLLESMKADNIEKDEETKALLSSWQQYCR